jgi:thymidylate kinase
MMSSSGQLYVFEGPDGVGKSELSRRFAEQLVASRVDCEHLSFPGRDAGTLGEHVYELHHHRERFGIERLSPTSLQLLHVAAHIDTIEHRILPALQAGRTVVLDRFWWSTMVYGLVGGVSRQALDAMIGLELTAWGSIQPTALFFFRRSSPLRPEPMDQWQRWQDTYEKLATEQASKYPVHIIENNGSVEEAMEALAQSLRGHNGRSPASSGNDGGQLALTFHQTPTAVRAPYAFTALSPARPTIVFDTYWRFAADRQAIFFKRLAKSLPPWTDDPILQEFKFTNAYRASDRVSQFLIKEVIYEGDQSAEEVFFRTILFKLFNKIETWQLLTKTTGGICYADYSFKRYDKALCGAIASGQRIYSAAYIMPSGNGSFGTPRKHQAHLKLLERMMEDELPYRIAEARAMFAAFRLLRSYPMIGDFLAYQYVTDLNYSVLTDFSEMEFVVPGPGAHAGIHKCFTSLGGLSESDIIKVVTDRQQAEFERLGLAFQSLWGRPLQLIDCQNLFCEVDKYARLKHPEVTSVTGRTRIKQKFHANLSPIDYWYPPKWDLNEKIARSSPQVSAGEKTKEMFRGELPHGFSSIPAESEGDRPDPWAG